MIEVNEIEQFDKIIESNDLSVVLFKSNSCISCVTAYKSLIDIYSSGIPVYWVDIFKNRDFMSKYSVNKIPTVMIFKKGRIVSVMVGAKNKFIYLSEIKKHLVI